MDFVVAAESLRSPKPLRDLPLVGNNVLQLIQLLGTQGISNRPAVTLSPFTFEFDGVNGRLVNFKSADGTSLRHDCFGATISNPPRDCSFVVSDAGISDTNFSQSGVAFRVKDGSRELEFTCQASQCKVEISGPTPTIRALKDRENGVIANSSAAKFTIIP